MRRFDWRDERGLATVFTSVAIIALLAVVIVVAQVAAATIARHRVEIAADLGALAGALVVLDGADAACAAARSIVEANGAQLRGCRTEGADVLVEVAAHIHIGPLRAQATSRSRAGTTAEQAP